MLLTYAPAGRSWTCGSRRAELGQWVPRAACQAPRCTLDQRSITLYPTPTPRRSLLKNQLCAAQPPPCTYYHGLQLRPSTHSTVHAATPQPRHPTPAFPSATSALRLPSTSTSVVVQPTPRPVQTGRRADMRQCGGASRCGSRCVGTSSDTAGAACEPATTRSAPSHSVLIQCSTADHGITASAVGVLRQRRGRVPPVHSAAGTPCAVRIHEQPGRGFHGQRQPSLTSRRRGRQSPARRGDCEVAATLLPWISVHAPLHSPWGRGAGCQLEVMHACAQPAARVRSQHRSQTWERSADCRRGPPARCDLGANAYAGALADSRRCSNESGVR